MTTAHAGARRLFQSQAGTTAIEFALVALPFLTLLLGIIEFSRVIWTHSALQFAVERAARCAVVNKTLCDNSGDQIKTYISSQMSAPIQALQVSYALNQNCGIEIRASADFAFIVGIISPSSMTLTAQSCYPT